MRYNRNFIVGKYFSFIKPVSSTPVIIKFKSKSEKFFSANTIIDDTIICHTIQELQIENEYLKNTIKPAIFIPFKIVGMKNQYYPDEKIDFLIVNEKNKEFNLKIVVIDQTGYIRYENVYHFEPDTEWINNNFSLCCPGKYKINFFYNENFAFYRRINVVENNNKLIINILKSFSDRIVFKVFNNKTEISDPLYVEEVCTLTQKRNYRTIKEKIPVKQTILYVPIKRIFSDINKIKLLSNLAIKGDFNPAGFLKVLSTIKEMSELEEIKFIKNLFNNSPDIAYTLAEEIFDIDLLFSVRNDEVREIINFIDNKLIAYAIKGLSQDKIEYIKNNISEKKWHQIETIINSINIFSKDEFFAACEKIGKHIRSYFQKKYGHQIEILSRTEERFKIQTISGVLNYHSKINAYTYYYPCFNFNGAYIAKFSLCSGESTKILFEINDQKTQSLFYENIIYETQPFWQIITIDTDYIYLKFKYNFSKLQIVILDEKNDIVDIFDTSNILNDEIIKLKYYSLNTLRLLIGAFYKENISQVSEADIIIEIYQNESQKIYIPEYSVPGEALPIKDLSKEKREIFIFRNDLKLPFCLLYKDFIELHQARKIEIQIQSFNNAEKFIYHKNFNNTNFLKTTVSNKIEQILLFAKQNNKIKLTEKLVYLFHPIIVEFIPYKNSKEGIVTVCNPSETLCEYTIEIDTPVVFAQGNFKSNLFITDIKFHDYCVIEIKNIFGKYKYIIKEKYSKEEIKIDITKKEELLKSLQLIKKWIYKEKKYSLIHLLLIIKVKLCENDKISLNFLLDSLSKFYFKDNIFRLKADSDFKFIDTAEALNKMRIFLEINNNNINSITSVISKALEFIKKKKFKHPKLWMYGKKYSQEYPRIIKHIKKQIKIQNKLTPEEKLFLYHNIIFTKFKTKAKKIQILPITLSPKFYLELSHNIMDLHILEKFLS